MMCVSFHHITGPNVIIRYEMFEFDRRCNSNSSLYQNRDASAELPPRAIIWGSLGWEFCTYKFKIPVENSRPLLRERAKASAAVPDSGQSGLSLPRALQPASLTTT